MRSHFLLRAGIICLALSTWAWTTPAATSPFAAGCNDLGFDLLRILSETQPNRNVLVSPVSLGLSLALLEQGADAKAEKEFAELLRVRGLSKERVREEARNLRESILKGGGTAQCAIAQSVWIDDRITVKADFLSVAAKDFGADVIPAVLTASATSQKIDQWVSEKTRGRIAGMNSPPLPSTARVALVNALYFKDSWMKEFMPHASKKQRFHGASEITTPVFMSDHRPVIYARVAGYEQIALAFQDGKFVLDLLLPTDNVSAVIKTLAADRFDESAGVMKLQKVDLKLPRFQIEDENQLTENMRKLGLHHAMDPTAADAFPGIAPGLFLSYVRQKTFIRVNEQGAEAAAATMLGNAMGLAEFEPPIRLTFDRPFVYAIRHRESGALLFLGVICNLPN
jgi:serine protease inhibitor